jgi:hypothetical protein
MGKRSSIPGSWVPRTLEMLRSPAWRYLPNNARRVLERLELEHLEHGGAENGKLICTYDDFVAAGLRRASVALAIRQCVALGFLAITRQGKRAIAEHRIPAMYRLTHVLNRYADGAKREPTWRRIQTDDDALLALRRAASERNRDTQPWPKIKKPDAPVSPAPDAKAHPVPSKSRTRNNEPITAYYWTRIWYYYLYLGRGVHLNCALIVRDRHRRICGLS